MTRASTTKHNINWEIEAMDTSSASPRRAHVPLSIALMLLTTSMLTACKKPEPPPTTADRLKYVEKGQETQPDFHLPRKLGVDYTKDLKAMKDVIGKPATPSAAGTPAASAPAESKPAVAETKAVATPTPAPPPVVATPVPTPVVAPPPAAAPTVVASAPPTARPTPARELPPAVTVLVREAPAFPREAARDGVTSGNVRARMLINAEGNVTSVVIVEAVPSRVFDRAVNQALSRWKFNAGTDGRTYETSVEFKS